MKRSRFFMGFTALVLGIAGVFVAKANKTMFTYYYQTTTGCPSFTTTTELCSTPGTGCTKVINNVSYQLYTSENSGVCQSPLKP